MRESSEVSPTCAASACISAGESVNPQFAIAAAALSAVWPITPAGALIAKYTPGVSTDAAISAITATMDSISIPPYPTGRTSVSFSRSLGVVPDATSA